MKRLAKLSWRARGSGGTCTAKVDHPIRGYRVNQRSRSNPFMVPGPEGATPTVSWISFDGDTYGVRLSAQGWPRTIRVTKTMWMERGSEAWGLTTSSWGKTLEVLGWESIAPRDQGTGPSLTSPTDLTAWTTC